MSSVVRGSMEAPPIGVCCRACENVQLAELSAVQVMLKRSFIVCTTCGHKRCPKATNHKLACTDSNASGQEGSDYQ